MKKLDRFRAYREQICEGLFDARALFITGLIIMPALVFNPVTPFRILQFLLFWFIAWLSGKKNNPVFTILVIAGIAAFNLIIPFGKVLFSIGQFKITEGALALGIRRAVTLGGLIMLSRFTIRPDLKIPGWFGELIGESFRVFAGIMNRKHRITGKNLIVDIDRMMLELSGDSQSDDSHTYPQPRPKVEGSPLDPPVNAPASRTKPAGYVLLSVVVILSWLPWAALIAF